MNKIKKIRMFSRTYSKRIYNVCVRADFKEFCMLLSYYIYTHMAFLVNRLKNKPNLCVCV